MKYTIPVRIRIYRNQMGFYTATWRLPRQWFYRRVPGLDVWEADVRERVEYWIRCKLENRPKRPKLTLVQDIIIQLEMNGKDIPRN